jgi:hypothetical protein
MRPKTAKSMMISKRASSFSSLSFSFDLAMPAHFFTMKRCRFRIEDHTVGWVCALPIELAAAVEMLDEEHHDLPQDRNDMNLYTYFASSGHSRYY